MKVLRLSRCFFGAILVLAGTSLGQEHAAPQGEAVEPLTEIRRIVLKRYVELAPLVVWRAADADARADVRFEDTFDRAGPARGVLERVRLGPRAYRIVLVALTESRLTCLVPAGQSDTIKKVLNLNRGQEITVEGTVVGRIGAHRAVLVDRILTGHDERSQVEHELVFRWPGQRGALPKLITKPGDYSVEYPCRHKKGEVERATVLVEQLPRKWFLAELERRRAAEAAAQEGEEPQEGEAPEKRYDTYRPEAVYRHAADGSILNVRFTDRVKGRAVGVPRAVPVPRGRAVRVGYAFDTYVGLTCIVPAQDAPLVELAARLIPGQDVEIKGTILPPVGAFKGVLVDELVLQGLEGPTETPDVWVVRVFWGEEEPRMFYEVGTYPLQFPCQFVEGRAEMLVAELREVRVIKGEREGAPQQGEVLAPEEEPEEEGGE